jgi:hypothetical protein
MATLTLQQAPVTGLADLVFDPADALGDDVPAAAGAALLVRNDDGTSKTVTVTTPGTVSGLAIEDPQVVIAAGDIAVIPLVSRVFGSTVQVAYSAVTSVTVAAVQVAR